MSNSLHVRPALLRELGKIAAKSKQDVSKIADDALRQFVRSHRETAHLTGSRANVHRLRAANTEIEARIAKRKRQTA